MAVASDVVEQLMFGHFVEVGNFLWEKGVFKVEQIADALKHQKVEHLQRNQRGLFRSRRLKN